MKKFIKITFWSLFSVVVLITIYNSYIKKADFFYRYKFGVAYNEVRFQKHITPLPENFIPLNDKKLEPLLVWVNPKLVYKEIGRAHV